jgi:polyisoprenoid-binding protein YceI
LIGGGLTLVVGAFLVIYFVVFPTSSPKPFALTPTTAAGSTGAAATHSVVPAAGFGGTWTVAPGSEAGYRVREKLAELPAESDAVGRTLQITGQATFTQSRGSLAIVAASFTVNVSSLVSDRSMRDERIHEIGLESSRYPTATFALDKPVTIATSAITAKVARVSITGTFDIHGVSKLETLPAEMSLSGATVEVVGSLTFPWGEFGMTAPSVGGFVDVTERATMEFDLRLQRS